MTWALLAALTVGLLAALPVYPVRGASRSSAPSAVSATSDAGGWLAARRHQLTTRLRRRSREQAIRQAGIETLTAFAAELRAGQPVRIALRRSATTSARIVCPQAIGVADLGGDVPLALERDAIDQSLPMLRSLAALWRVAEVTGAGLAEAADRLGTAEADADEVRRELTAQLAGPKATARVLAGLPLVGLMLGSGLGASPVAWLLGSGWGIAVLVVGCALEALGIWWTVRLTRSVELLL